VKEVTERGKTGPPQNEKETIIVRIKGLGSCIIIEPWRVVGETMNKR